MSVNVTEAVQLLKDKNDFYSYRLGLKVQAYGGALIIALGLVGKFVTFRIFVLLDLQVEKGGKAPNHRVKISVLKPSA